MQELEKILKEIKEVLEENKVIELNGDCTVDRCIIDVALAWDSIKAIIHNHINDGWIPVEERLPDNNENVLVTTDMGLIASGYIAHGTWITDQEPDYPIAWRPLPEPYRPEKERERVSGVKLKTTLKRCPFCGKEVDTEIGIGGIRFFNCTNKRCGAMVSFRNYIKGKSEIDKWNGRIKGGTNG